MFKWQTLNRHGPRPLPNICLLPSYVHNTSYLVTTKHKAWRKMRSRMMKLVVFRAHRSKYMSLSKPQFSTKPKFFSSFFLNPQAYLYSVSILIFDFHYQSVCQFTFDCAPGTYVMPRFDFTLLCVVVFSAKRKKEQSEIHHFYFNFIKQEGLL